MKKISFKLNKKNLPVDCIENIGLLAKFFDVRFMFDFFSDTEVIIMLESMRGKYKDGTKYLYNLCKEYNVPTKNLDSYISVLCMENTAVMLPFTIK